MFNPNNPHQQPGQQQFLPPPVQPPQIDPAMIAQQEAKKQTTRKFILTMILTGLAMMVFGTLGFAVLQVIGEQASAFHKFIKGLFYDAPHMMHSAKGFGAFVQLIAIAIFVGWTLNRFKRKK
jgi:hypothetical protein